MNLGFVLDTSNAFCRSHHVDFSQSRHCGSCVTRLPLAAACRYIIIVAFKSDEDEMSLNFLIKIFKLMGKNNASRVLV